MYRFFHLEEKVCFTHWLPQGGRGYQRMYFEFRSWCHRSGSTWKNRSRQSSCPKSSCGAAVQADKFRLPLPSHFVQLVWGVGGGGDLELFPDQPGFKVSLECCGSQPCGLFQVGHVWNASPGGGILIRCPSHLISTKPAVSAPLLSRPEFPPSSLEENCPQPWRVDSICTAVLLS